MYSVEFDIFDTHYAQTANTVEELVNSLDERLYNELHLGACTEVELQGNNIKVFISDSWMQESVIAPIICTGIAGTTADGETVYYHPQASHSHRPELDSEAISHINSGSRGFIRETVNLGYEIGFDHLVEVDDDADIVYFDRGRGYYSRMVLNVDPEPTSNVTLVIARCGEEDGQEWAGKLCLITLFEGQAGFPENDNSPEADDFWMKHALVPTDAELEKMKEEGVI